MSTNLINALASHLDHPDTFDVPDVDVLAALVPGDYVKLGFLDPDPDGFGGERMWVEVTARAGSKWAGKLANTPFCIDIDLSLGDEVRFGPENILDTMSAEEVES